MANYLGKGRSNYVRVKDGKEFTAVAEKLNCEVITEEDSETKETLYGLMDSNADGGGWDFGYFDEDDEWIELDPITVLSPLLQDGEVMVLMEVGSTKYRYLVGHAVAFNNAGKFEQVDINDIYLKAKNLGDHITKATY